MPHDEALARLVSEREADMIRFLARIVDMDSPTEDKRLSDRVGAVLADQAASVGLAVTRDAQADFADNLVCRSSGGTGPRVLLVGHFDTVYAAGTAAARPFTVSNDRATGPGVLDMKGGLTVGLFALQALRDRFGVVPLPVTFLFNSDEETGSPASRRIIEAEAVRHDLALVLEPGRPGPALTVGRKGVGIFQVDVRGVEAHAGAEPEKGASAIVDLAHKLLAIQALNDPAKGTTVTPGVIAGGTKPYVVPGHASLQIDCRAAVASERNRVEKALAAIVASVAVPGTSATLAGGFHRPPMELSDRSRTHILALQDVAASLGFPLGTATTGGASDGNNTAAVGTPTIDGLGVHGGRAHSAEEYIELHTLGAKARVLACYLAAIASRRA